jgi:hypothetical protein
MAPLFNHGHADALSITLALNGKPLLVDPGTFRYNGAPEFRRYFKGTRAHNTVTVDGEDQAVQETGFIWNRPFASRHLDARRVGDAWIFEAAHNGYRRLGSPVEHRRRMLVSDLGAILIRDSFEGKGIHDFELNFHLHSEARVGTDGAWRFVDHKDACIFIRLLDGGDFSLHAGEENPPFGWHSPAYGARVKSTVLSCRLHGPADGVSFVTALCAGAPADEADLRKEAGKI